MAKSTRNGEENELSGQVWLAKHFGYLLLNLRRRDAEDAVAGLEHENVDRPLSTGWPSMQMRQSPVPGWGRQSKSHRDSLSNQHAHDQEKQHGGYAKPV